MRRKINKKRINFSFFYKYFFILIFFLIIGYNYEKINENTVSLIEKLSFKYEYIFLDLQIVGLKLINEKIIIDEFEKYKNKSIFFIPLDRISKKIKQNNWVKSVKISNNYKNKLHVNIIEEQPAGIFITKDQNILFSKNFKILDFVDNLSNWLPP